MTYVNFKRAVSEAVPYRMRDWYDAGGPDENDIDAAELYLIGFAQSNAIDEFYDAGLRIGRTPKLFNDFTKAVATLAFREDGIRVFGVLWNIRKTHLPPGKRSHP